MVTGLFSHSACLAHDTGEGHPECADRLRAILARLEGEEFLYLDRREAPLATPAQISRIHPGAYLDQVMAAIPPSWPRSPAQSSGSTSPRGTASSSPMVESSEISSFT